MTMLVGTHPPVKSAERTLAIFEYFAVHKRPATTGEISLALGWPQSSTSVLLRSLVVMGYLTSDGSRRAYYPSMRFALLGSWLGEALFPFGNLTETMRRISREAEGTVVLAVQSELDAQYIHIVGDPDSMHVPVHSGMRRPMGRVGVGKILLSLKSDDEIRLLVRRINAEESNPRQRLELTPLLDEIGECRSRGYARSNGSIHQHADSIAMNVPLPKGQPPMAIGVGGERRRVQERCNEIVHLMKEALRPYHSAAAFGAFPS